MKRNLANVTVSINLLWNDRHSVHQSNTEKFDRRLLEKPLIVVLLLLFRVKKIFIPFGEASQIMSFSLALFC